MRNKFITSVEHPRSHLRSHHFILLKMSTPLYFSVKTTIEKTPKVAEQLFGKLSDALRSLDLGPDFGGLNRLYERSTFPFPS